MVQVSAPPVIASTPSQIRQIAKAKFWHDKVTELIKERVEGVDFRGQIGDYKVTSILAVGGMSVVFEVEDVNSGNKYVAKIGIDKIKKEELLYLYQEGRILAHLDDKRIVKLVDVGIHEKYGPFVVMEQVTGKALSKLLDESQYGLPIDKLLSNGVEICRGVASAHDAGVIVRDISPQNTIVSPKGIVLIDFGIARHCDLGHDLNYLPEFDPDHPNGSIGVLVGKHAYVAPEQITKQRSSVSTDIYALGVVLYEMATGKLPFISKPKTILMSKIEGDPEPPIHLNCRIGRRLNDLIMSAVERNPDNRISSAHELRTELEKIT